VEIETPDNKFLTGASPESAAAGVKRKMLAPDSAIIRHTEFLPSTWVKQGFGQGK
jgi:hypothetical protein